MSPVDLLQELIAIPSVNPMGRDVTGTEYFETRLTEYLLQFFADLGVEYEQIEVVPGRSNVLARFDAGPGERATILLDAHQDTVPTDGMTIPPFTPTIEAGRLYGRGACDVKGGLAAMLSAFSRLVRERPAEAAHVVISCTCDEEATTLGVRDLVRLWADPDRSSLLSTAPDAAIVAEPTDLNIVVAHRGATRWKLQTTGRACHSSRPEEGINAIYRMARVLACLEEFAALLPSLQPAHPRCGTATLSVGRIEGGISVNVVPDRCGIEIDRRVIPGEDPQAVVDQVHDFLRERLDFDVQMDPPWLIGLPLSDERNRSLADQLLTCIRSVAQTGEQVGVPYGTHASRIDDSGVPAVVFGPGSIEQAHTRDEWISIDELQQATEIYYQFCATAGPRNFHPA